MSCWLTKNTENNVQKREIKIKKRRMENQEPWM